MVGQTILQYQLLEKLGAGGMGEVYKAQDTRLNRVVAIKVLPAAMSADADPPFALSITKIERRLLCINRMRRRFQRQTYDF